MKVKDMIKRWTDSLMWGSPANETKCEDISVR